MVRNCPLLGSGLIAMLSLLFGAADALAQTDATSESRSQSELVVPSLQLAQVVQQRIDGNTGGIVSQGKIEKLSDETDSLAVKYKTALHQIDALTIYNKQVKDLIASQQEEVAGLKKQIDEIELAGRLVTPLMFQMIEALDSFLELDVPFLPEERTSRVAALHEIMSRSDVTDAERYRRILETYQIENEYGRTIEAYSGSMQLEGQTRTVDFLRVGRIVLLYQTRDGTLSGAWDQKVRDWKPLPSSYRSAIRQGFRIARKEAAPDLLRLPVPAPEAAQ